MFIHFAKIISLFLISLALIFPNFVFSEQNLSQKCEEIMSKGQQDLSKDNYQSLLKECQAFYEEQVANIEKDINKTGQEKKTLQDKVWSLNNKIKSLNYQIYQSNLVIDDLKIQIEDTGNSIQKSYSKIEDSKEKLANILRNIYEEEQKSTIEILLSEEELSGFFNNLTALDILNNENKELLQSMKDLKLNLERQNENLGKEKQELEGMVKIHTLQKNENVETKQSQQHYLNLTEQEYQKQLKEKADIEKKAQEVRARIFELIGVSKAPTFGEAYEIAKYAEGLTGIRPAFLLAILQQESSMGKNVGQCYLKNPSTGTGVSIQSGASISRVMKPSRDVQPFLKITKALGRDPYETSVSCPLAIGWGGAMGPAQFIPSTWIMYKAQIEEIINRPADPWNMRDAFLASAVYLTNSGAKSQTRNGEWRAAMIYFSGSTTNSRFYWYANNVLNTADGFQQDIEALEAAN
ncbi:MAG: lytic murein transglycosylase [Patescibacteria group bacterium]|nr:lytic murein transglycosylase [Patescibacteria group bacterium]